MVPDKLNADIVGAVPTVIPIVVELVHVALVPKRVYVVLTVGETAIVCPVTGPVGVIQV